MSLQRLNGGGCKTVAFQPGQINTDFPLLRLSLLRKYGGKGAAAPPVCLLDTLRDVARQEERSALSEGRLTCESPAYLPISILT